MSQKPKLIDDRIAAAISHPTRLRAMNVLWEREASPREIAAEIGEPINNVTYHIKQLVDLGWIEPVGQRSVRGGRVVEHFYRAIQGSRFEDSDLESLGQHERVLLDIGILKEMANDLGKALLSGTYFELEDNQLMRIPMQVDMEGWKEAKEILDRALDELLAVRESVANRAAGGDDIETFPTRVNIIQFKSARPEVGDDGDES